MFRTLVIDDEFGIRHIIKLALSRLNIEIAEAETASEGLEQFNQILPHLILMDLRLPDMSGADLTHHIRITHPDLPIVFMSASTELAKAADQAGATTYLEKPFKLARLQDMVLSLLPDDSSETTR